jgi:anti-anti-sigma factor
MRSSFVDVAGVVILRLRGELDVGEISALSEAFGAALHAADGLLVLDLEEVSFIDVAAAVTISRAVHEAGLDGCTVSVISASARVRKVFEMTGNDGLLTAPSSLVDVEIAASIEQSERAGPPDG